MNQEDKIKKTLCIKMLPQKRRTVEAVVISFSTHNTNFIPF